MKRALTVDEVVQVCEHVLQGVPREERARIKNFHMDPNWINGDAGDEGVTKHAVLAIIAARSKVGCNMLDINADKLNKAKEANGFSRADIVVAWTPPDQATYVFNTSDWLEGSCAINREKIQEPAAPFVPSVVVRTGPLYADEKDPVAGF